MPDLLSKLTKKRATTAPSESSPVEEPSARDSSSGDTDDRLVALFKNRAELKKAFSELRAECDELRERLAQAESDPAQSYQRLAALEQRLSERETAYPALVYFQLRGLWRFCHNQLIEFSEQLQEQHLERERGKHEEAFHTEQQRSLTSFEDRLQLLTQEFARERQAVLDHQARMDKLKGFWNHFRRRAIREEMSRQEQLATDVGTRLEQLRQQRQAQLERTPPEFEGLSAEARRKVNLAVLAFAQYLYVEFAPNSLASLSRDATQSAINEVSYGSQRDCEALMEIIERSMADMAGKRGYGDELKLRARHLKLKTRFESDTSTVPTPDSMMTFPLEFHQGQAGMQVDVNILADDYWNLTEVLLS